MKKSNIICWMLVILIMASCSKDEDKLIHGEPSEDNKNVLLSGEMNGVSVLIFGKNDNNQFVYKRRIDSGWSAQGRVTTEVEKGNYQFLFMKTDGINPSMTPTSLSANGTLFSDVSFSANINTDSVNYVLPVEEIWLPETDALAGKTYTITADTTIKSKLKRAVSQVGLHIKRGTSVNDSLPFTGNDNIMRHIREVKMDILGVGKTVTAGGTPSGSSNTVYISGNPKISDSGFAIFEGPFVFPPAPGGQTQIKVTIIPKPGSPFPVLEYTTPASLVRNEKIDITLWITATYQFVDIEINMDVMPEAPAGTGDEGIWE